MAVVGRGGEGLVSLMVGQFWVLQWLKMVKPIQALMSWWNMMVNGVGDNHQQTA